MIDPRKLETITDHGKNLSVSFDRSPASVDDSDALRFTLGNCQEGVVDTAKERAALLLEAVFIGVSSGARDQIAVFGAGQADGEVAIQHECQVRLDIIAQHAVQGEYGFAAELTASTLVGFRRIRKAVAENVFAGSERGQNDFAQMLNASGEHQRQLRVRA